MTPDPQAHPFELEGMDEPIPGVARGLGLTTTFVLHAAKADMLPNESANVGREPMATNRRVFCSGVAPCVVGVFVALFSASTLGEEIQCDKIYSLANLTAEDGDKVGTKGCMRVLVPDVPGIKVTEPAEIDTHIVTAFIPESYRDARYDIKGAPEASKYMTVLSPEGSAWVSTSSKVESLMALGSEAWVSKDSSELLHRVVDSSFSITEGESKLTLQGALEGESIPINLAMIKEKLSQTDTAVANCFINEPWSKCYNMAAPSGEVTANANSAYESLKEDYSKLFNFENEEKYKGRGIWVSSPAERLTNQN